MHVRGSMFETRASQYFQLSLKLAKFCWTYVVKIAIFGLTHWLKHRITRKLLKIDRYLLRGVWQALNCLSIHGTYWVIVAGASPGETKMWAAVWKRRFFALAVRITGKLLKIDGYMFVITKQSTFSGPPGGAGNFFFVRFAREHRTPHYHFCNSNTGGYALWTKYSYNWNIVVTSV